jgi:hypothetical protein
MNKINLNNRNPMLTKRLNWPEFRIDVRPFPVRLSAQVETRRDSRTWLHLVLALILLALTIWTQHS